ncbi:hypothetical protein K438DRAFT_1946030 [Mycena galopus ATCC 62051]|nr:hypothetical protein K438DRAFT_1946030 [Mycena galopus ATCC 62051]
MDRATHPETQATGRVSLRGLAQGLMGGHDITRPFSTTPFIGRHQSQYFLHDAAVRSDTRRRVDSDAIPQRVEHTEPKSRREGTKPNTLRRLPEPDWRGEMQTLRDELARLLEENRQYKAQVTALQSRQVPPADASMSAFGITANLTSIGDARRTMEDLDAEILQTAAALSEFDFRGHSARSHPRGSRGANPELHNRLIPILGSELLGLLSSGKTPAILLQIALQTVMSAWSCTSLCAWVLDRESDRHEGFLADLYAEICRVENTRDAARWRAMTRKQLVKRASPSDMGNSLLQDVVDVIILTKSGGEEHLSRKTIEAAFGDRIEAVVRLVLDLNRDMGTRILSDELEVILISEGTRFDSRTMENMWPQDDAGKLRASEVVVCTTGLGLRKSTPNGAVVFMKPKVLLRSTVGQLMA